LTDTDELEGPGSQCAGPELLAAFVMVQTIRKLFALAAIFGVLSCAKRTEGATLSASFSPVAQGAEINLTAVGAIDWVHWGLITETSANRKALVPPVIGGFKVVDATNGYAYLYQYSDNYNGYSWHDGAPVISVTNTPTGLWVYGIPNIGSGFEFSVPADTTLKTLTVYVGTFNAKGRFTATLSDASAPVYVDSSLSNRGNGPGGAYRVEYAANSAGQYLTIRWVLNQLMGGADGNVTLQAAALTAPGANNPPFAAITSPIDSAAHPAGQPLTIRANAFDDDGSVAKVEFFQDTTKLGEATTEPYSFDWTNVPIGLHRLSVRVTDTLGGSRPSAPVELVAHATGGTLVGTVALPAPGVDLTAEGTLDWVHRGLLAADNLNRKANVTPLIGSFAEIGTNELYQFQDNFTAYSWSDGTPIVATNDTRTGIYVRGAMNGFTFSVPATIARRTLKVYVGLYGTRGLLQAYLSDFSTPVYADASLGNIFGNDYGVYTLDYAAAAPGQNLIIRYTAQRAYDEVWGNVTLQAATLAGQTSSQLPPTVSLTSPSNNATFTAPAEITISADAADPDGTISRVEFFADAVKLGEATTQPYRVTWSNAAAGSYMLSAKATDNDGLTANSGTVSISVVSPNSPPIVRITRPVNNSIFTAPANITIEASATDSDGVIAKVEFFEGTNKLGEASGSPSSFSWNNAAAGTYALTARATDDDGATTTSDAVMVAVAAAPTPSPATIFNVGLVANQFTFSFQTKTNWTYAIQFADSLGLVDWQTLRSLAGTGETVAVTNENSGNSQRFFRVQTQ
jgi:hypothetical protein